MKRRLVLVAFPIAMLAAGAANAGACQDAGSAFLDINANALFCEEAHWAKNALITTGCAGEGTLFCPNDSVSRAQMALFIRRMALAVHPEVLFVEDAPAPGDLDAGGFTSCATAPYDMVPPDPEKRLNPRFWNGQVVVSMQGGASDADVQVALNLVIDGALTFALPGVRPIVTVPAGQWRNASVNTGFALPLFDGSTYRWRIVLARADGSATTGELASLRCQLKVATSMQPFYEPEPGSDPR